MLQIHNDPAGSPIGVASAKVDGLVGRLTIRPSADTLPTSADQEESDGYTSYRNPDNRESMLHRWKSWWSDRPTRWILIVNCFGLAVLWLGAWWLSRRPIQLMPLHYTIYFDIDRSGSRMMIYLLPGFASLVLLLHIITSVIFQQVAWWRGWMVVAAVEILLLSASLAALWARVSLLPL